MVASFCLRLAWGMIAAVVLLPRSVVPPRFFRVQYLTSLGLLATAGFFLRDQADALCWGLLGGGMALCFLGSMLWHVDGAPGGFWIGWLSTAVMTGILWAGGRVLGDGGTMAFLNDLAGAWVLGAATAAMLMGHSYLIAPAMSLVPLFRLLAFLGGALVVRSAAASLALWSWTRLGAAATLDGEMLLWLPVRWLLGILAPLFLAWMAWETARIRSTQSATGLLYVVVILCFLGELTAELLLQRTGHAL